MRVAYFPSQCAQNSLPVMEAVLSSLKTAGHEILENSWDADTAIVWSVLWHGRMSDNRAVWSRYREQGRPVIIIDVGSLFRGRTWKIALNSITAQGYYGHTENLDWDRPKKLGILHIANCNSNPRIVIAAQHARSLQVADLDSVEAWILERIIQLRTITDRPIAIRPHPRSLLEWSKLVDLPSGVKIEHPRKIPGTYDSYDLTFDCHALVNHNSGPGIQAAIAGIPPIVDSTSLAHPVSIRPQDIDKPYVIDRQQWLTEICHTEYTLQEIQQGLWLKRLQSNLVL